MGWIAVIILWVGIIYIMRNDTKHLDSNRHTDGDCAWYEKDDES